MCLFALNVNWRVILRVASFCSQPPLMSEGVRAAENLRGCRSQSHSQPWISLASQDNKFPNSFPTLSEPANPFFPGDFDLGRVQLSLSVLQLDPADRAVIKIAGNFASVWIFMPQVLIQGLSLHLLVSRREFNPGIYIVCELITLINNFVFPLFQTAFRFISPGTNWLEGSMPSEGLHAHGRLSYLLVDILDAENIQSHVLRSSEVIRCVHHNCH